MLLSKEALRQIDSEVAKVFARLRKDLRGDGVDLPYLEQVYLAGKVASLLGPDKLKTMTPGEINAFLKKKGITKTAEDEARLTVLLSMSDMWIAGMQDEMLAKIRKIIVQSETSYLAEVTDRQPNGSLRKSLWDDLKKKFAAVLITDLAQILENFEGWVDRFLQTELAKFFQEGQTSTVGMDEEVYKIPRATACEHCLRLHIDSDGNPLVYPLRAVLGNSNIGQRAANWRFTIGPVHPHCYCILYRVSQDPPRPRPELAQARQEMQDRIVAKRQRLLEEAQRRLDQVS